ncbi:hypothetical protein JXJ21_26240 [candidate division KSB1 bacterium]|nr:hypothetical protein [candidate division KSB1 bacterium]
MAHFFPHIYNYTCIEWFLVPGLRLASHLYQSARKTHRSIASEQDSDTETSGEASLESKDSTS